MTARETAIPSHCNHCNPLDEASTEAKSRRLPDPTPQIAIREEVDNAHCGIFSLGNRDGNVLRIYERNELHLLSSFAFK